MKESNPTNTSAELPDAGAVANLWKNLVDALAILVAQQHRRIQQGVENVAGAPQRDAVTSTNCEIDKSRKSST